MLTTEEKANSEKAKTYSKAYREANKEIIKDKAKTYREANKDNAKTRNKAYYEANKDNTKARNKAYREANKDNAKAYYEANKDNAKTYSKAYNKARKKTDPLFRLSGNIRSLIGMAFKKQGWRKTSRSQTILGCDFKTLHEHLIATALSNYGRKHFPSRPYEIDHIIPISSAKTEEDLVRLNHHSNLQFLYKQHNRAKSGKLDWVIPTLPLVA